MTVRDIYGLIMFDGPIKPVTLSFGSSGNKVDLHNFLSMQAFGDFKVAHIMACAEDEIEIEIEMCPVKEVQ